MPVDLAIFAGPAMRAIGEMRATYYSVTLEAADGARAAFYAVGRAIRCVRKHMADEAEAGNPEELPGGAAEDIHRVTSSWNDVMAFLQTARRIPRIVQAPSSAAGRREVLRELHPPTQFQFDCAVAASEATVRKQTNDAFLTANRLRRDGVVTALATGAR